MLSGALFEAVGNIVRWISSYLGSNIYTEGKKVTHESNFHSPLMNIIELALLINKHSDKTINA